MRERRVVVDLVVAAEREVGTSSARSGSLPPPAATSGNAGAPVAAKAQVCVVDAERRAPPATSWTKDGRLAGPRVTWKTAFVSGPPPTMSRWIAGLDARRELGPAVEQRQRALDLGRPDEAERARAARARRPSAISFDERARDLQDRGAAAGVVVGARARMVEVAAEDDLLAATRADRRPGSSRSGCRRRPGAGPASTTRVRAAPSRRAPSRSCERARLLRARP